MATRTRPSPWARNLTVLSAVGLLLGIGAGYVGEPLGLAPGSPLGLLLDTIARAWINALRLIVIPLVTAQLFAVIAGARREQQLGRLGGATSLVFIGLQVAVAAMTVVMTYWLLALPGVQSWLAVEAPAGVSEPSGDARASGHWVDDLVPSNLVTAAASGNLVGLMVFAAVFACAARRLPLETSMPLVALARGVVQTCYVLVDWLLRVTPLAVFALAARAAAERGATIAAALLAYVGVEVLLLGASLVLFYAVVVATGSAPFGRFVRAALDAQITALSTRSSLATIPILMREARERLGVPDHVVAYVLPLAGAVLKASRAVSNPAKVVVIAVAIGLDLSVTQLITTTGLLLIWSTTTVGVASVASGARSLPIYVAAGLPPDLVLLLGTATGITDPMLTLVNSTSYLTSTVLVGRIVRSAGDEVAPSPVEAPLGRLPESA